MEISGRARLGSGQCGIVTLTDGTRLYVSYSTVVGIELPGQPPQFTDARYSVTTSKQRTTKLYPAAGVGRVQIVPHAEFLELSREVGLSRQGWDFARVVSPHTF